MPSAVMPPDATVIDAVLPIVTLPPSEPDAELAAGTRRDVDAVVGAIAIDRAALVIPLVRDDPCRVGVPAAGDHGMASTGLGHAVGVESIGINNSLRESRKPGVKVAAAGVEQIGRKLVDRNQDDQLWRIRPFFGGRRRCCRCR